MSVLSSLGEGINKVKKSLVFVNERLVSNDYGIFFVHCYKMQSMFQKNRKLILTIDGGGIRGVLPLLILAYLEKRLQIRSKVRFLSDHIDLIAGTSTGAIISAGLAARKNEQPIFSIQNLLRTYRLKGPKLFDLSEDTTKNSENLYAILSNKFKELKLSDLNCDYLFLAFDQASNQLVSIDKAEEKLQELKLSTTLAACSSIPGFFNPVSVRDFVLMDGFVLAKNPTQKAYLMAKEKYNTAELIVVSLGTGNLKGELYDDVERRGEQVHQFMIEEEKKNNLLHYFRFQPDIIRANPEMSAATPENIHALLADGRFYIQQNADLFESLIAHLLIK